MIYFMQAEPGGPIKIGHSDDPERRRGTLEWHYQRPLVILGMMEGGADEERAIHERFAHLRFGRTEQFRPDPELMEFIGMPQAVMADPATVEAMAGRVSPWKYIRMDDELCEKARKLAALRGTSMAEMFGDWLRPIVDREWTKEVRKLKEDEKP